MSTSARGRRARYGTMTLIVALAATASLPLINIIGARTAARFDLTATGEHRLSPRTEAAISALPGEYELVLAAPLRDPVAAPPRALERVRDVLDQISRRAAGRVRVTTIDTGSSLGATQYQALVDRLTERDRPRLDAQTAGISSSIATATELASAMESLQTRLLALRDQLPATAEPQTRVYLEQRAGESGISARALRELAQKAQASIASPTQGSTPAPNAPGAVRDLESVGASVRTALGELRAGLADIATNLARLAGTEAAAPAVRQSAQALVRPVKQLRDRAAVATDALERLPRLDLTRVARVLERASALLIIGPAEGPGSGVTAVRLEDLLPAPSGDATGSAPAAADVGRNAEELLATALSSLVRPIKPIVIVMHGQSRGFLERSTLLDSLKLRLGLRGIDVLVWETATQPEPPSVARLDPKRERPVVYVVLNTQNYAADGGTGQSGPDRVKKLGAAIVEVAQAGHPILLTLHPSTLPAFGEPDPTSDWLSAFGLKADTGRTLLRERITPEGRRVEMFQRLRALDESSATATNAGHPILRAVRGLPTKLEWPVAIERLPSGNASEELELTPLYAVDDKSTWAESQWLSFIQVRVADHARMPDLPRNDGPKDSGTGPWLVAVAAQRALGGLEKPQRIVVVGSNTWFLGPTLDEGTLVDGRVAASNPGNAELLEASVYWLAGEDAMIGASPSARAVPLVKPLTESEHFRLRLALVLGLPGAVLVLAGLYRWRTG